MSSPSTARTFFVNLGIVASLLFFTFMTIRAIREPTRTLHPATISEAPAPAEADTAETAGYADASAEEGAPEPAGFPQNAEYVVPLLDYSHQYHRNLMERARANAALPEDQRDPQIPTPAQVEESERSTAIPM